MSIPFIASVAICAVEVATNPELLASGKKAMRLALQSRFPEQHPLLLGEHLDYATLLVRSATEAAARIDSGAISKDQALAELQHSYQSFPSESVGRALAYGVGAPNNSFKPKPLRGSA